MSEWRFYQEVVLGQGECYFMNQGTINLCRLSLLIYTPSQCAEDELSLNGFVIVVVFGPLTTSSLTLKSCSPNKCGE